MQGKAGKRISQVNSKLTDKNHDRPTQNLYRNVQPAPSEKTLLTYDYWVCSSHATKSAVLFGLILNICIKIQTPIYKTRQSDCNSRY